MASGNRSAPPRLDSDAWTATFRIANWDEKTETPFKLVYVQKHIDGSETQSTWSGKIKANPSGRPLRIGALTCQNHYGFPYEPVAENVTKLDPDLLYFSGDQLYESHGGYGLIREPAEAGDSELPAQVLHVRLVVSRGDARSTDHLHRG